MFSLLSISISLSLNLSNINKEKEKSHNVGQKLHELSGIDKARGTGRELFPGHRG